MKLKVELKTFLVFIKKCILNDRLLKIFMIS